jgi:hypothetical protein
MNTIHAYAAGILDGEGSITLAPHSKSKFRTPTVTVSSTTIEILDFLKENFGGYIVSKRKYKDKHTDSFVWGVTYKSAYNFLVCVLPYMKEPKKIYRTKMITEVYPVVTVSNGQYSPKQLLAKQQFEIDFYKME